jgi:hypothetical protein
MLGTVVTLALTATACGGGDKGDKPAASAEPQAAATAAPAPPPPAATTPAPAETAAPAPPPEPEASSQPDKPEKGEKGEHGKHGKGAKGEKGEHGEHGEKGAKEGGGKDKSEKVIRLGRAHMEFNHPGNGWVETKKGPWTIFHPKDKTSVLAFVEFERPNESTKRIGEIAANLELTNLNWKGNGEEKLIGPSHLKAHYAVGTCKVATNKHECELEYYTVEGALLIVYAFENDVKKTEKKERMATRTVESLRRM